MRVDLGTANPPPPDFHIYVDRVACPGVPPEKMLVCDLNKDWPIATSSCSFIRAHDIIEHLHDKIHTMNELWRVLKPFSVVEIVVPTTDGTGAFQDPTHVSYWNRRSFLYYEKGNPYRERFATSYGIKAAFLPVMDKIEDTQDGPKLTIQLAAAK